MDECFKLQAKNNAKNKTTGSSGEADIVEHDEGGVSDGEVMMVSDGNVKDHGRVDSRFGLHLSYVSQP